MIAGSVAFRNSSAAVSAPAVSGAQAAPAAPSGHGGWTIESSVCGGSPPSSAASLAKALASSEDQPLSIVPAGTS